MGARLYPEAPTAASKRAAKRRAIARGAAPALVGMVLGAAVACSPVAAAGPTVDAEWRIVSSGSEATPSELALTVTVEKGWHVNANDPDRAYLIPTTLEIDPPAGVIVQAIRYPEPVIQALGFDPGAMLRLYEGTFTIAVRVAGAPPARLDATLGYQACNDATCLPPRTVPVPFAAGRVSEGDK
ncbi:MAG: protein-disulfide reductase DsbD N-terminal domain-containing protein [Dehalococcoidia bacterium]|nr:protein-disulfide reductase DsbD N-terminal domain-containing protein [Dehalococcoidia bacterium]